MDSRPRNKKLKSKAGRGGISPKENIMEHTVNKTAWHTFQVIYKNEVIAEVRSEKRARIMAERMEGTK